MNGQVHPTREMEFGNASQTAYGIMAFMSVGDEAAFYMKLGRGLKAIEEEIEGPLSIDLANIRQSGPVAGPGFSFFSGESR